MLMFISFSMWSQTKHWKKGATYSSKCPVFLFFLFICITLWNSTEIFWRGPPLAPPPAEKKLDPLPWAFGARPRMSLYVYCYTDGKKSTSVTRAKRINVLSASTPLFCIKHCKNSVLDIQWLEGCRLRFFFKFKSLKNIQQNRLRMFKIILRWRHFACGWPMANRVGICQGFNLFRVGISTVD